MQNDTSQFVVNIIPLQNIQTNASGLDATTELSNAVANIQQMVNFEEKRVFTDYLSAYTTNGTIQVLSPMNMSDAPFTLSGVDFSGASGGGSLTVSSLTVGGNITINGSGSFTGSVSATSFITVSDRAAKTDIQNLEGSCIDRVKGLSPYRFRYSLGGEANVATTPTVGLMAQEVETVLPEAVCLDTAGRRYVNYDSIVAVLLGAVKELQEEIAVLKSRL
jgi:hypothetical protein